MNERQARQARNKLLISTNRDGWGYTYAVSALGVVVATGWVRTDSQEFAHKIAEVIGKTAVDQWVGALTADEATHPMVRIDNYADGAGVRYDDASS